MTNAELIKTINDTVDTAIEKMNSGIPGIQQDIFDEIQRLAKDLDYKNGKATVSVKNIRIMGSITRRLRRIILSTSYQKDAAEYLKAFNTVTSLQNQYLASVTNEFTIGPVLKQIKSQAIADTAISLTQEGLTAGVINKLRDILRINITTGGTFKQLMEQVRAASLDTDAGQGILNRYVKTITTDALNQYSRNYLQTATASTGLEWYQYTGSLLTTSRSFCVAMVKKRFFNVKEIPKLLAGDFKEFKDINGTINTKTGLPDGMIEGTNVSNFITLLGGYGCGHRAIPVDESLVPLSIRNALKSAA